MGIMGPKEMGEEIVDTVAPVLYSGREGTADEMTLEQRSEAYSSAMEGTHCRGSGVMLVYKGPEGGCVLSGEAKGPARSWVKFEERRVKMQREVRLW